MSQQLQSKRIRILCEADKYSEIKDANGDQLTAWLATDLRFELGIKTQADWADLSNIASVTIDIYDARTTTSTLKATKTTADITALLTTAQWDAHTHQNALIEFTGAETDFAGLTADATYWLAISALTTDSPAKTIALGAGSIVFKIGRFGEAGTAPAPAVNYYTRDEADARHVQIHAAAAAVARGSDGYDYLYSADTGNWHRLQLQQVDSTIVLAIEQTGVTDPP